MKLFPSYPILLCICASVFLLRTAQRSVIFPGQHSPAAQRLYYRNHTARSLTPMSELVRFIGRKSCGGCSFPAPDMRKCVCEERSERGGSSTSGFDERIWSQPAGGILSLRDIPSIHLYFSRYASLPRLGLPDFNVELSSNLGVKIAFRRYNDEGTEY